MSVPVRIPDELADRAQAIADKEKRSLANTIAVLIEEALSARFRRPPPLPAAGTPTTMVDADAQSRDVGARTIKPDFKK